MSAYITLATPMLDEDCLIAAIVEQGFNLENIVRSEQPRALRGWQNNRTANIILAREHTGDTYNDVGFLRGAMGYTAILSNDHAQYGSAWLSRVSTCYQAHWAKKLQRLAAVELQRLEDDRKRCVESQRQAVHERAKKMGYLVQERQEGNTLRMVLIKRTY